MPNQERFRPLNFIIVSLEPIPDAAKRMLESRAMKVVDSLKPNGENIKKLHSTIRELFPNFSSPKSSTQDKADV